MYFFGHFHHQTRCTFKCVANEDCFSCDGVSAPPDNFYEKDRQILALIDSRKPSTAEKYLEQTTFFPDKFSCILFLSIAALAGTSELHTHAFKWQMGTVWQGYKLDTQLTNTHV